MYSSTITLWIGPFPIERVSGYFFIITTFYRQFYIYCKQCRPDQTPRSAASVLGLHCLPISLLWDARLKWVKADFFRSNDLFK